MAETLQQTSAAPRTPADDRDLRRPQPPHPFEQQHCHITDKFFSDPTLHGARHSERGKRKTGDLHEEKMLCRRTPPGRQRRLHATEPAGYFSPSAWDTYLKPPRVIPSALLAARREVTTTPPVGQSPAADHEQRGPVLATRLPPPNGAIWDTRESGQGTAVLQSSNQMNHMNSRKIEERERGKRTYP